MDISELDTLEQLTAYIVYISILMTIVAHFTVEYLIPMLSKMCFITFYIVSNVVKNVIKFFKGEYKC